MKFADERTLPLPSCLHGWDFLRIIDGGDLAPPLCGQARLAGPAIVINSLHLPAASLADRRTAVLWLAPALHHICCRLLEESMANGDDIGRFTSRAWCKFRSRICLDSVSTWPENVQTAKTRGVEWTAEALVLDLLFESGFLERLNGGPELIA